jgi:hypothetical protein
MSAVLVEQGSSVTILLEASLSRSLTFHVNDKHYVMWCTAAVKNVELVDV